MHTSDLTLSPSFTFRIQKNKIFTWNTLIRFALRKLHLNWMTAACIHCVRVQITQFSNCSIEFFRKIHINLNIAISFIWSVHITVLIQLLLCFLSVFNDIYWAISCLFRQFSSETENSFHSVNATYKVSNSNFNHCQQMLSCHGISWVEVAQFTAIDRKKEIAKRTLSEPRLKLSNFISSHRLTHSILNFLHFNDISTQPAAPLFGNANLDCLFFSDFVELHLHLKHSKSIIEPKFNC